MKTKDKRHSKFFKTPQRFGLWLRRLIMHVTSPPECTSPLQTTVSQGKAPPFERRWYGCKYGLWRLDKKPVPIRTTRFRRT